MIKDEKDFLEILDRTNFAVKTYFTLTSSGIVISVSPTLGTPIEGRFYFGYNQVVTLELWTRIDDITKQMWINETVPIQQAEQLIEKLKTALRFFNNTVNKHTKQFKNTTKIRLDQPSSWEAEFTNTLRIIKRETLRSLSHYLQITYIGSSHKLLVVLHQDAPDVADFIVLGCEVTADNYKGILNKLDLYVMDFQKNYPTLLELGNTLDSLLEN